MTAPVTVDLVGADRLRKDLKQAAAKLDDLSVPDAAAARVIAAQAARRAPRRTGALARSIRPAAARTGPQVTATVSYAPFVEYGTRHMAARPFLYPAAADTETQWTAVYERHIETVAASVKGA